ncbi:MAG: formyltransferase family protein [Bacteroidota bacterium]
MPVKVGIISIVELSIPLLQYLQSIKIEIVLYIGSYSSDTSISSLISFCNASRIDYELEENPEQLFSWFEKHQPDYCFVLGYKKRIDVGRLTAFRERLFNIHPGKLPQYRGASPIFWQIKNGEPVLGIAIHFMNEQYDAGEIVWSREIANEAHYSSGFVEYIFSNLLVEGVHYILQSGSATGGQLRKNVQQDETKAVTYKKPTLPDVLINWQTMNANQIVNLTRACNPWNKGAITVYNGMEVKVIDAEALDITTDALQGVILEMNNGIRVACAEKTCLKINHLNINGIYVPARFGHQFGFTPGQYFLNS